MEGEYFLEFYFSYCMNPLMEVIAIEGVCETLVTNTETISIIYLIDSNWS